MDQPLAMYEGRMAEAYDRGRSLLPEAEEAWAATVTDLVPRGATVVDVGAGTGRFARPFVQQLSAQVVAVEPAARMRTVGGRRPEPGISWLAGQAEALPLRDRTADVLWLSSVIHYIDLDAAGPELARVVRDTGRVLVRGTFPDRFDQLEWLHWFPAARAIDEARMPAVDRIQAAWAPHGLRLEARIPSRHVVARDLHDLADRLAHRAISTLALISDEDFERGLAAARVAARTAPARPIYSQMDVLSFVRTPTRAAGAVVGI